MQALHIFYRVAIVVGVIDVFFAIIMAVMRAVPDLLAPRVSAACLEVLVCEVISTASVC